MTSKRIRTASKFLAPSHLRYEYVLSLQVMDSYFSIGFWKLIFRAESLPVHRNQLPTVVIKNHICADHIMVTIDDTSKAVHPAPSIPWSRANALQRMDGDEKLLLEILQIFLQEYPKQIAQMDRGLAELKPDLLEQAAHSLKGELGFLGVPEIEHLARQLEEIGRRRQLTAAVDVLASLKEQLSGFVEIIRNDVGAEP